jgi:hypothetical protein
MVSSTLMTLVVAATVAFAQETIETSSASSVAATTTESQSMPPQATANFNAAQVNETVRCKPKHTATWRISTNCSTVQWCRAQLNTCPQICGGAAAQNYCEEVRQASASTKTYILTPDLGQPDVHLCLSQRHSARRYWLCSDPALLHLPADLHPMCGQCSQRPTGSERVRAEQPVWHTKCDRRSSVCDLSHC